MMTSSPSSKLPSNRLLTFSEPRLRFAHDQVLVDPKDGLMLFGPPPQDRPAGLQVRGHRHNLKASGNLKPGRQSSKGSIAADTKIASSVMFPGFETVFRTPWNSTPRKRIEVDGGQLEKTVKLTDPHQRVFDTVDLFAGPIRRFVKEEDRKDCPLVRRHPRTGVETLSPAIDREQSRRH